MTLWIRTALVSLLSVLFVAHKQDPFPSPSIDLQKDIHKKLEKKICEFHGTEDAILYNSCFDANAGLFEALLTKDDIIFSDALNHASIIDGIRLCKVTNHSLKFFTEQCLRRNVLATNI